MTTEISTIHPISAWQGINLKAQLEILGQVLSREFSLKSFQTHLIPQSCPGVEFI